jgi:hypothetical protein
MSSMTALGSGWARFTFAMTTAPPGHANVLRRDKARRMAVNFARLGSAGRSGNKAVDDLRPDGEDSLSCTSPENARRKFAPWLMRRMPYLDNKV